MVDPTSSTGAAKAAAAAPIAAACSEPITKDVIGKFSGDGFTFLGCAAPTGSARAAAAATSGTQGKASEPKSSPIQR